jgi:hypothetical protein
MLLDLGRALSFFLGIVTLYVAAMDAFFQPGSRWEDRLAFACVRLALAGCVCLLSGVLFAWNTPDQPLRSTLPVKMFLWAAGAISVLFAVCWYLHAGWLRVLGT